MKVDVTDLVSVESMLITTVDRCGQLDILVNNAEHCSNQGNTLAQRKKFKATAIKGS